MGQGYQNRDYDIIDYQLYKIDDIPPPLRGPTPVSLKNKDYFVCIGAAQTFGCYCEKPYPTLLQEKLSVPVLNFGLSGAGPLFFISSPNFLKWINNAKFAIVQVLSGRSENNSLFYSNGKEMLTRRNDGKKMGAAPAYSDLLKTKDQKLIEKILAETRQNWLINFQTLLNWIKIPKILLWFSVRTPDYKIKTSNVNKFFGDFPQLVDSDMIKQLKVLCDDYVECVSSRGLPQLLISRFSGRPTTIRMRPDLGGRKKTHNDYYPSPEMQIDAANLLVPACKKIIAI